jgi:hypothetical protein
VTEFCFEHVFRAPSTAEVFAAFFDDEHQLEQDRQLAIAKRELLELDDRGDQLYRRQRITPERQLPAIVKPFVSGPLHYIESQTWRRSSDEIALEIRPSLLGGRARVEATYSLASVGEGAIRRRYAGRVSVDVAILATRIERGIVQELVKSLPIAARCTQDWLDRT